MNIHPASAPGRFCDSATFCRACLQQRSVCIFIKHFLAIFAVQRFNECLNGTNKRPGKPGRMSRTCWVEQGWCRSLGLNILLVKACSSLRPGRKLWSRCWHPTYLYDSSSKRIGAGSNGVWRKHTKPTLWACFTVRFAVPVRTNGLFWPFFNEVSSSEVTDGSWYMRNRQSFENEAGGVCDAQLRLQWCFESFWTEAQLFDDNKELRTVTLQMLFSFWLNTHKNAKDPRIRGALLAFKKAIPETQVQPDWFLAITIPLISKSTYDETSKVSLAAKNKGKGSESAAKKMIPVQATREVKRNKWGDHVKLSSVAQMDTVIVCKCFFLYAIHIASYYCNSYQFKTIHSWFRLDFEGPRHVARRGSLGTFFGWSLGAQTQAERRLGTYFTQTHEQMRKCNVSNNCNAEDIWIRNNY